MGTGTGAAAYEREEQVARRFCDKAVPGQTMTDPEYAECYDFVLYRRTRTLPPQEARSR